MPISATERIPRLAWLAVVLIASLSCSKAATAPSNQEPLPGTALVVANNTTGGALDADGYQVLVDQTDRGQVALNASLKLSNLAPGEHTVELRGLSDNCVAESSTQTIVVAAGETAVLLFKIRCTAPVELGALRLVFARDDGLYAMTADGSGLSELVPGEFRDPAVSPDGRWIAFSRSGNLHVIRTDGSEVRRITPYGGWDPAWSPDGTRLAFVGPGGLHTIAFAGGNPVRLTNSDDGGPAWSPGGGRIAFTRWDDWESSSMIGLMNADGTGQTQLGRQPAWSPIWSPDGGRIAFLGLSSGPNNSFRVTIFVMEADGSGVIERYSEDRDHSIESLSDWSPDGRWIAFTRSSLATPPRRDVYLLGPNGALRVTSDGGSYSPAFLRP